MKVRVPVEVDITYVNKTWFSIRNKKSHSKNYVLGLYQRAIANVRGISIIRALPDNKPETIIKFMLDNAAKGCIIYCQENILPKPLYEIYEVHELKESDGHSKGDLHINNVNNMWKDLKRLIKREHISVSKKHLQLYCSEVSWRINHAHLSPSERFGALISSCAIKSGKTSYKNLVK